MKVHDKIRLLREKNHWSQEKMAEKLNMSQNGYARIERGETKLHLDKMQQIAEIFNMDIFELMTYGEQKSVFYISNENSDYNLNTQCSGENSQIPHEIEKLKLIIQHQEQLLQQKELFLEQKDNEITALKELIQLLKK